MTLQESDLGVTEQFRYDTTPDGTVIGQVPKPGNRAVDTVQITVSKGPKPAPKPEPTPEPKPEPVNTEAQTCNGLPVALDERACHAAYSACSFTADKTVEDYVQGSGYPDLATTAHGFATKNLFSGEDNPIGVAIDPGANRIYWANSATGAIRVAGLNGSPAPSDLFTGESDPNFAAVLRPPAGTGPPSVSGGGQLGQALSCTQGSWAADLQGAQLYRSPGSFAYQWLLNGAEIGGAAGSSYTPSAAGGYSCRVTATNQAGSTAQTSSSLAVTEASAAEDPGCKRLRKKRKRQQKGLAKAATAKKRTLIRANIKDTKKRLKRLGCT